MIAADVAPLVVEVWSDVICPWCYIGKRRFERAVELLDGEIEIQMRFRPFQLDPRASPGRSHPMFDAYVKKFGSPERARALIDHLTGVAAEDGLEFRLDRARRANTLLAHRLLWWAEQPGVALDQGDLAERLLRAYFVDGTDVGDPDALADLAAELGADRSGVLRFLEGDAGRAEVGSYLDEAADRGITAVPTYVVDGRWAIPGAQDTDTFVRVLRRFGRKLADECAGSAAAAGADP